MTIQPRANNNPPPPPHFKLPTSHPTNLNIENPEIKYAQNGMYFWGMLLYKRRGVDWNIS
jgi:hypothetical protein